MRRWAPLKGNLVAIASEMLEELLQAGHARLQIFPAVGLGIIRGDDREGPCQEPKHY
jgi:hypothetical protein